MGDSKLRIIIDAVDKASTPIRGIANTLQSIGTFAAGNLVASGIQQITGAIVDLGSQALTSYANHERLSMSIEALVKREVKAKAAADGTAVSYEAVGAQAQELLQWTQKLAIQSPFDQAGVADTFRTAMAYGFTSDEAQKLTSRILDLAAATGGSTFEAQRIALALGQIRAKGKVSAEELNQLREAGFDVNSVLRDMNANLDDVSKGLVSSEVFIQRAGEAIERDFGGAAKAQANTFSGLLNSLQDLKDVGLRELFAGTFQAIQPYLQVLTEAFANEDTLAKIRQFGDLIGQHVKNALEFTIPLIRDFGAQVVNAFKAGGVSGVIELLSGKLKAAWPNIQETLNEWATQFWGWLNTAAANGESSINSLVDSANAWFSSGWPKIQASLTLWRDKFWDWMIGPGGVIEQAGTYLNTFAERVSAWATTEGRERLGELGTNIGAALFDGLTMAIEDQQRMASMMQQLIMSIGGALLNVGDALNIVGANIAEGILQGFLEKFLSADTAEMIASSIGGAFGGLLNTPAATYATIKDSGAGEAISNYASNRATSGDVLAELGGYFANLTAAITSQPPIQVQATIDGAQVANVITPRVSQSVGQQIARQQRSGGVQR